MRTFIASSLLALFIAEFVCLPVLASTACDAVSIRLRPVENVGYRIEPKINRSIPDTAYLLSIDGRKLDNESLAQLNEQLVQCADRHGKIEYVFENGDTGSEPIVFQGKINTSESTEMDHLRWHLQNLPSDMRSGNKILEADSLNFDILQKAICRISDGNYIYDNGCPSNENLSRANLSMSIGDFAAADKYLSEFLKEPTGVNSDGQGVNWFGAIRLIRNLVSCGKIGGAKTFCDYLSKRVVNWDAYTAPFLLYAYSMVPDERAKNELVRLLDSLPSNMFAGSSQPQCVLWIADQLDRQGNYEHEFRILNECQKDMFKIVDSVPQISCFSILGPKFACMYRKARVEAILCHKREALSTLDLIEKEMRSRFNEKQLEVLERLPAYFPKFSHLQQGRDALEKGENLEPAPAVNCDSNTERIYKYDACGRVLPVDLNFSEAVECQAWLNLKNQKLATASALRLIGAYQKSNPMQQFAPVRQNLFSTCVTIIRKFTDMGYLQSANSLLNKLESVARTKEKAEVSQFAISVERLFIESKLASKSTKDKAISDTDLSLANAKNSGRESRDYSLGERLRLIATCCHYAGNTSRSVFFIEKALSNFSPEHKDGELPSVAQGSEKFVLYMTAAAIFATDGDRAKAISFASQAASMPYHITQATAPIVLETAYELVKIDRTDLAISLLEGALKKEDRARALLFGTYPEVLFHRSLAVLYKKTGQSNKCFEALKAAAGSDARQIEDIAMLAEACEQRHMFKEASENYRLACEPCSQRSQRSQAKIYVQKAIENLLKVPGHDSRLEAQLYILLARFISGPGADYKEISRLYAKADTLLLDSDPEKAENLSRMAFYHLLEREEIAHAKGVPASVPSQEEIESNRKTAIVASQSDLTHAGSHFMTLARIEALADHADAAAAACRRSIELYSPKDQRYNLPEQIFIYGPVLQALRKVGKSALANELIELALKKVVAAHGTNSMEYQSQLTTNFSAFIVNADIPAAEHCLKLLLATKLDLGRWTPPNHDMSICRGGGPYAMESSQEVINSFSSTLIGMVKQGQKELGLNSLQKILLAEKEQFGTEDYRVGLTLSNIGKAYYEAGEYDKAQEAFLQAVPVLHKYEKLMYVREVVNPEFYQVYKKLNRLESIASFESRVLEERKSIR